MMKFVALALLLAVVGSDACHNSTGGCLPKGKYECLDGSFVTWAQRCDGKEDCKDGIDEFMCPRVKGTAHEMEEQASCGPQCACEATVTTVLSTSSYWVFATKAPVWGASSTSLMLGGTGTQAINTNGAWGCNPDSARTTSIVMIWYKKGSASGCVGNQRRRGFICCGRALACNCLASTTIRCG
jgi:hypothetical protein